MQQLKVVHTRQVVLAIARHEHPDCELLFRGEDKLPLVNPPKLSWPDLIKGMPPLDSNGDEKWEVAHGRPKLGSFVVFPAYDPNRRCEKTAAVQETADARIARMVVEKLNAQQQQPAAASGPPAAAQQQQPPSQQPSSQQPQSQQPPQPQPPSWPQHSAAPAASSSASPSPHTPLPVPRAPGSLMLNAKRIALTLGIDQSSPLLTQIDAAAHMLGVAMDTATPLPTRVEQLVAQLFGA